MWYRSPIALAIEIVVAILIVWLVLHLLGVI